MAGINGFPGFISDFVRGTTRDFHISVKKDGEAVDITGCKFYITFSEACLPVETPQLEIIIDPPSSPLTGETIGVIADDQTLTFKAQTYYYSVRFINASGSAYVVDMGKIKVKEAISERVE